MQHFPGQGKPLISHLTHSKSVDSLVVFDEIAQYMPRFFSLEYPKLIQTMKSIYKDQERGVQELCIGIMLLVPEELGEPNILTKSEELLK